MSRMYSVCLTMPMPLRIAKGLALPDDGVTQTYGPVVRNGAGKTYGAGKLVDEGLTLGAHVIVIDPGGNWYGVQVGRDGGAAGLPIPVFGREHGNVPITAEQGGALTRLPVPRQLSAVVDVSAASARTSARGSSRSRRSAVSRSGTELRPWLGPHHTTAAEREQRSPEPRQSAVCRSALSEPRERRATSATFSMYIRALNKNRLAAREVERCFVHRWLLRGPGETT